MSIRRWRDIGLNGRTAILMVIPMVVAISVFGYFVTVNRIDSLEKSVEQRSEILVRHFSSMIELGMVAQDKQVLASYADVMLKEEGVVSVLMQDVDNNILVKKESKQGKNNPQNVKYSSAPVFLSGINVGGIESETTELETLKQGLPIGFVRVGVLLEKSRAKQEEILWIGLISTFLGILISSLISFRISRLITQPVLRLKETVNLLTAGKLSARVKEGSKGEIGALERGINNMAESLHGAQNELLAKINKATNELNLTVLELEQRNIELEKSRLQAEQLGNDKSQFLARMSHELRTPLNAVVGFSRLIGKKNTEQDRQEYTQSIIDSAEQLTSVIDDVLTFSKLKSGTLNLHNETFNPRSICENIVIMQSGSAQEKNIELVLLIDESIADFIDGDVLRINQVLTNLLNNAIKFTESGDIVIRVKCLFSSAGNKLIISVTDTGCGIDAESIYNLFNEFSQVDNSAGRQSNGVGLGLSIARQLALKMRGDITVNSEVNKGSCFSFCIPLLNPVYKKPPEFTDKRLSTKNVLLFDSHSDSRLSLQRQLQGFGMRVFEAANEKQVNDFLINSPPNKIDLLVLVFSAEQLKNIQYENMINTFEKSFNVPVLILAGINGWELPLRLTSHNPMLCMSKPLRQTVLYQNILNLLKINETADDFQTEPAVEPLMDNKHVLVAEDNRFNQTIIKMMLKERAAQVTLVDNANDAIAAAANKKFSLILMDLHMPGCDGISAARTIRKANNESSQVPIVLVTADVLSDMQRFIDEGIINQILYKPIDETRLDQVLEKCIGGYEKKYISQSKKNKTRLKISGSLRQEVLRLCVLIKNALKSENMTETKKIIHQLVGVSGYYQLDEVSALVTDLQGLIQLDDNQSALAQLDKLYALVSVAE